MVSPASKDTTEDLQNVAGASEGQAPGEQAALPAGQTQVLSEVGAPSGWLLGKANFWYPHVGTQWWIEVSLPRQWLSEFAPSRHVQPLDVVTCHNLQSSHLRTALLGYRKKMSFEKNLSVLSNSRLHAAQGTWVRHPCEAAQF